MGEVNLTGAKFPGAKIPGANLTGVKKMGAKLTEAKFPRAKFPGFCLYTSCSIYLQIPLTFIILGILILILRQYYRYTIHIAYLNLQPYYSPYIFLKNP